MVKIVYISTIDACRCLSCRTSSKANISISNMPTERYAVSSIRKYISRQDILQRTRYTHASLRREGLDKTENRMECGLAVNPPTRDKNQKRLIVAIGSYISEIVKASRQQESLMKELIKIASPSCKQQEKDGMTVPDSAPEREGIGWRHSIERNLFLNSKNRFFASPQRYRNKNERLIVVKYSVNRLEQIKK